MLTEWYFNMLEFRYIEPDDIAKVVSIINRAYRPVAGEEGWTHESDWIVDNRINAEQLIDEANTVNQHIVVPELNGSLVGCVMFSKNQHKVNIGLLTVDPRVQTQQVGRKLLAEAEQLAIKLYQPICFEMSVVNTRKELIAFYQRRGYRLTEKTKPYPIDQGVGTPKKPLNVLPLHLVIMQKPVN